ncbi:MAG TPA: plastocyanin/azurin family copper-binding protein [Gemmatimonadales bacterium]
MLRKRVPFLAVLMYTLACGGGSGDAPAADQGPATSDAPAAGGAGAVVEVRMITDDQGNRFEPADVEVRQGDILRLVLVSGVHNLHFLPDSNPGATGLPPASEMLQLPGQTLDVPITMGPGHYYFQCDPHALLGMVGKLEVEDD